MLSQPTLSPFSQGPALKPFALSLRHGFQPFSPLLGGEGGGAAVAQSLTNVQKLSLPTNTAVGTNVLVTDGFVLHDGVYGDVFYYTNGTAPSGGTAPAIEKYSPANRPDLDDITWRWNNANDAGSGGAWGDGGGNYAGDDGDITHFWDTPVGIIDHTYTFTYPASQRLGAASTTQGGVFVLGGEQPGVYRISGESTGKDRFNLVGYPPGDNWGIEWEFGIAFPSGAWNQWDFDQVLIAYSDQDVATPDLVTLWKNGGAAGFVASGSGATYGPDNASPNGNYTDLGVHKFFRFSDGINTVFTIDISESPYTLTWLFLEDNSTGTVATSIDGLTWTNDVVLTPSAVVPLSAVSASVGELNAGLRVGDNIYVANGGENGWPKYTDILGNAPDVTWDGTKWSDGTTDGEGTTAFPWGSSLGVRDNVAAEANWQIIS